MSDIKPLSYANPMEELKAILSNHYPDVDLSSYDLGLIRRIASGERNTELLLVGNPAKGMMGSVKLNIDRLDPAAIFNRYGAVNKKHTVRLSAMAGASMKLSDILAHINNLLGTNLTLSGNYPDFANTSFVAPEKNQKVTVTIGAVDSATGDFPVSLRIAPGKPFTLDVLNAGAEIATTAVNRSLYPFSSSAGNLIWTLEKQTIASPKVSTNLLLFNLDFTPILGTAARRAAAFGAPSRWLDYNNPIYPFVGEAREKVVALLRTVGIEYNDNIGMHTHRTYTIAASVSDTTRNTTYCRSITETSTYFGITENGNGIGERKPVPLAVNTAFSNVMKLYPADRTTFVNDGSAAYNQDNILWYLHFNKLAF